MKKVEGYMDVMGNFHVNASECLRTEHQFMETDLGFYDEDVWPYHFSHDDADFYDALEGSVFVRPLTEEGVKMLQDNIWYYMPIKEIVIGQWYKWKFCDDKRYRLTPCEDPRRLEAEVDFEEEDC